MWKKYTYLTHFPSKTETKMLTFKDYGTLTLSCNFEIHYIHSTMKDVPVFHFAILLAESSGGL